MIKAIIFDLGGVVTIEYRQLFYSVIANALGVDDKFIVEIFDKYHVDITKGKMTLKEMYKKVINDLDKDISADKMLERHMRGIENTMLMWNNEVISYIEELKKKYVVACLSNTEVEVVELNRKKGLFDHFNKTYVSTELKMLKPDAEIYRYALKDIGCKPEEAIFIDNIQIYVDAAEKVGIKSILFQNCSQLKNEINKLASALTP